MTEKLKRVGEVCKITGLKRKQLFDYEDIVPPDGYLGHRSCDGSYAKGYKLYGEESIKKLYMISVFRELQVRRSDIKKFFSSGAEDSHCLDTNKILRQQLAMLEQKRKDIDAMIAGVTAILAIGTDDIDLNTEERKPLTYFGRKLCTEEFKALNSEIETYIVEREKIHRKESRQFTKDLIAYANTPLDKTNECEIRLAMQKLWQSCVLAYGGYSYPMFMTLGAAIVGKGTIYNSLKEDLKIAIDSAHGKKMAEMVDTRLSAFFDAVSNIFDQHDDYIFDIEPKYENDEEMRAIIRDTEQLYSKYFAVQSYQEYQLLLRAVKIVLKGEVDDMMESFAKEVPELCFIIDTINRCAFSDNCK